MRDVGEKTQVYARAQNCLAKLKWLPPLAARLSLGYVFITSGWGKLHGLEEVTGYFTELGLPAPHINAIFVASSEFVFGLMLMLGLFTRLATFPLIVIMAVALLTARREDLTSLSDLMGFIEYLYILPLMWLLVEGGGCVSLDRWLCRRCRRSA